MRSYSIAPRRRVASAARSRDFCFCFVLEGENGGQVEVRGVLVFFSPGFRVAACAGSVVFVSSSLALLARSARGKVNFLLWSPGQSALRAPRRPDPRTPRRPRSQQPRGRSLPQNRSSLVLRARRLIRMLPRRSSALGLWARAAGPDAAAAVGRVFRRGRRDVRVDLDRAPAPGAVADVVRG